MGVALAVALMAGGLSASNMGFKLNYGLTDGGASGTNAVALPYNAQTGLVTAFDVINDIGLANVSNMQKFLEDTDTLQVYTGRKGSPGANFNITAGEGYRIRMISPVDYIVVGSHDPSAAIALDALGAGSASGTNEVALPYHITAVTAFDVMTDIGLADVSNMQKFLTATDTLQVYTGRKGSPGANFTVVPGESYRIRMINSVSYTPSHY
jgi:hypothetical protein